MMGSSTVVSTPRRDVSSSSDVSGGETGACKIDRKVVHASSDGRLPVVTRCTKESKHAWTALSSVSRLRTKLENLASTFGSLEELKMAVSLCVSGQIPNPQDVFNG